MLYKYLTENYEQGEPIFAGDISIPGLSEENLRYHLKRLTDAGILCRFEAGIYYFPGKGIFGEKMVLTADTYLLRQGACPYKSSSGQVPYLL